MRANLVLTTAASLLLASTVFVAAQGTQKQGPGAEGSPPQGQMQREGQQGQQGKQAPQKGDRGENAQQKGSSQAQEREGPKGKQQVQKEQQGQKEQGKQQGQKERTDGQGGGRAETQKGAEPKGKAGERTEGQRERTEGQQKGERTEGQQKGERTDTQRGERSGSQVTLTTEQRTKVRETVLRGSNAPRVTNVNFSIRVGTVVPTSVRVVEVAPVLIEVHPEWRGFFYFIVNDQIIIVDRNHHIVAVIDV
jgi:Protein of unknown function (DUF1236)